jgi:1,2-diacylglycerol 3-alpha-glucosyltransferase
MRIAILTPTFLPFSGIDRAVELQARELRKKNHEVSIFTFHSGVRIKGVKVFSISCPKNTFLKRLYRLLFFLDFLKISKYGSKVSRYDWVISHLYPMNIIACYAKKKNPNLRYTFYNNGVGLAESYGLFETIYLRLFNFLTNLTIKRADDIISISKFLRNQLLKETKRDSKVLYIEIDKARFHKGLKGNKIREKYGVGNGPLLFYVGRLSPHKGIHILIEAFKQIQEEYPKAKPIIGGKPTFRKYYEKLRKMSNRNIIFPGFISDKELPQYYAAADVYVTASLWEGYDMPLVEAQAVGKPAVAFDAGAHREVLRKGRLVRKGDVKGFANAIAKVLKK